MTLLENKIKNVTKAIQDKRTRDIVIFKYHEYMKVYDSESRTLRDKLNHHELFYAYYQYIKK